MTPHCPASCRGLKLLHVQSRCVLLVSSLRSASNGVGSCKMARAVPHERPFSDVGITIPKEEEDISLLQPLGVNLNIRLFI